jgi:L-aminopeptidase/D-esterase-like protein
MQMEKISVETYPNPLLNPLFEGVVQATEEAILNALVGAKTMTGRDGHRVYGLPHDEVRAIVSRNGASPK